MKKYLIVILSFMLSSQVTWAATTFIQNSIILDQNEIYAIDSFVISSTIPGDITAQNGIHVLLDPYREILWDKANLVFSGTALDTQKVQQSSYKYSKDYKSVFIPILKDFDVNDTLEINGLALRSYKDKAFKGSINLDLTGDMMPDVFDTSYEVTTNVKSDNIPPYAVQDLAYQLSNNTIKLNWNFPPDYDYNHTVIRRHEIVNGVENVTKVYEDYLNNHLDIIPNFNDLEKLSYEVIASDHSWNLSDAVTLEINLNQETPSPTPSDGNVQNPPSQNPPSTSDEINKLNKLLNYFYLRYQATCLPSEGSVKENNYACLWDRIRLIHAQELTGNVLVPDLTLSEKDLELMALRRQWPELRYESYCISTQTYTQEYCSRLYDDLNRLSYFLD